MGVLFTQRVPRPQFTYLCYQLMDVWVFPLFGCFESYCPDVSVHIFCGCNFSSLLGLDLAMGHRAVLKIKEMNPSQELEQRLACDEFFLLVSDDGGQRTVGVQSVSALGYCGYPCLLLVTVFSHTRSSGWSFHCSTFLDFRYKLDPEIHSLVFNW